MSVHIVSAFVILFEVICEILFFDTFMRRRAFLHKRLNNVLLIFVLFVPSQVIARFIGNILLKSVLVFLLFFLFAHLFYRSSLQIKLVLAVVLLFLGFGTDIAFGLIFMQIFSSSSQTILSDPLYASIGSLVSKSMFFVIVLSIRRFWRLGVLQKTERGSNWVILLYTPLIAILTIITFLFSSDQAQTNEQRLLIAISSVGLTFLSLVIFYLAQSITDRQRKIRENDLLKQKVEIEMGSVAALADSFQNQRQMMHDYNNQMDTIRQLLADGHCEQACDYVGRIAERVDLTLHRIRTRNEIIDAVLNQKDIRAKKMGVRLLLEAEDLSGLPMQSDDVVAILANVLDNALEACEHLAEEERVVQVKLLYRKGQFIFSAVNPVSERAAITGNHIDTTKGDKELHGLGLRNIAAALEKYGATYELFCDENTFQFTTVIDLAIRPPTII